jgi:hypothetical protein
MPRFRVGFSEEAYGYYYFDAKDMDEALDLMEKVEQFEIDVEDLPAFNRKVNGEQHEWINPLEEVN